jgi:hypothetical protein
VVKIRKKFNLASSTVEDFQHHKIWDNSVRKEIEMRARLSPSFTQIREWWSYT